MKITGLESLHADGGWRVFSFLKLTTDEGLVGWSEYNEGFGVGGVSDLIARFAPVVAGMDPRRYGKISATLRAMTRLAPGGLNDQAIAAIENACLDVAAKAMNAPVAALFGGPLRERLPLYWSHCGSFRAARAELFEGWGVAPVRSLDDMKALAADAVARGFLAVKTNPVHFDGPKPRMFDSGFRPSPRILDRNIDGAFIGLICDQLEAFRDGLGPHGGLMLDINFNQRTEGFLRVAKAVERFDLTWLEIDMHDPDGLALVRRSSSTPIASLEAVHGMHAYRPYFERYACDVAVIDVPWNGALEAYRIATLADAYEVNVAPHNFYGHLASLMSAHLCAAIPNFRIMEYEVDDVPWKDEFVTVVPEVKDGHFHLPAGPGWGTDVNEDAVRARPPKR